MPVVLLRTYNGRKILQIDTGSSLLLRFHINFYYQYAKFRNAAYEIVYLDSFQVKLKAHSQLSKKFVDSFRSLSFCAFNHLSYSE